VYTVSQVKRGGHFATLINVAGSAVFCAVAEANEKDKSAYAEDTGFERLLLSALRKLPGEVEARMLPKEMATAVGSLLVDWHATNFGPQTVIYAGVLMRDDEIYVCTAGDCRIHLIRHEETIEVTRDHNAIDDPAWNAPFPVDEVLLPIYLRTTTRTVGIASEREPECGAWRAEGNWSVLICSSEAHRYRQPNEYVEELMRADLETIELTSGLVIRVNRL
jgi:serine/threonine protein phosphatase PrpC